MPYGHRRPAVTIQNVRPAYCIVSKLERSRTSVFFIAIDRTFRLIDARTSFVRTIFLTIFCGFA